MSNESIKHNHLLKQASRHWKYIAPIFTYPKNRLDYKKLTTRLDQLLDIVGDDENHPLIGMVDVLSNIIASYEDDHLPSIKSNGVDALKYLMESNQLNQADLSEEIGSQGVVSEVLNGKRELNIRQVKALAKRFHVNVSTFIDMDE